MLVFFGKVTFCASAARHGRGSVCGSVRPRARRQADRSTRIMADEPDEWSQRASSVVDVEDDAGSQGSTLTPDSIFDEFSVLESIATMAQAMVMKLSPHRYARDFVQTLQDFQVKVVTMMTWLEGSMIVGTNMGPPPAFTPYLAEDWAVLKFFYDNNLKAKCVDLDMQDGGVLKGLAMRMATEQLRRFKKFS